MVQPWVREFLEHGDGEGTPAKIIRRASPLLVEHMYIQYNIIHTRTSYYWKASDIGFSAASGHGSTNGCLAHNVPGDFSSSPGRDARKEHRAKY